MQIIILYALVVLIWGSTWVAITFQLGPVASEVSVAYRFAIASLVLFAYAFVSRRRTRIPLTHYPMVMLQGAILFSANYLFVYYGTAHLTSGLIAVLFSVIVVFNSLFEKFFFGTPVEAKLLVAAALGAIGVALMFWSEVAQFTLQDDSVLGILLIAIAIILASLGNMTAVVNTSRNLPVVAVNAHAMAWGALTSACIAWILGYDFNFSLSPGYVWSLLYLSVFGSAVAFGCYLALIRSIGSARAAYSSVLFPLVALTLSTFFEGYVWTGEAVAGIALILGGNWMALAGKQRRAQEMLPGIEGESKNE